MTKDQSLRIRPVAVTDELRWRDLWHETNSAGRILDDRVGVNTPLIVYQRVS